MARRSQLPKPYRIEAFMVAQPPPRRSRIATVLLDGINVVSIVLVLGFAGAVAWLMQPVGHWFAAFMASLASHR